ncbi:hypothetical protein F183_A00840 [Bryobacterales bacterium F-183]|nr:hypothetical protein F183_A00840 [Bryobacterales bacterium F-183]
MSRKRWFAPEVIQTSAMDCGPAALKSLLEGFGISASYGRLREACHTDVDGTSIDSLEEIANKLGLIAEQVVVPVDHLLIPEAALLPCIVVVKLEGAGTHFVVVWRRVGAMLQVMDPAAGLRWVSATSFLRDVYLHTQQVPADGWLEWARSDDFLKPLAARMRRGGVSSARAKELIRTAAASDDWQKLAALDASVHLATSLGEPSLVELCAQPDLIPLDYWRFVAVEDEPGELYFRGAVALRAKGTQAAQMDALPESLRTAVGQPSAPGPMAELWSAIRQGGMFTAFAAFGAGVTAALAVLVEALLFRSIIGLAPHLPLPGERFAAAAALVLFLLCLALLEWSTEDLLRATGRQLELRMRMRFHFKIPRLGDRYFQSRLISDMAQRAHAVQGLRQAPVLAMAFVRGVSTVAATVAGIIWFYPHAFWPAIVAAFAAIGVPLLGQPLLVERDLRFREYSGSLTRFYLDALLGIVPVRTHGAGPALRWLQSSQLRLWADAGLRAQRLAVGIVAVQLLCSYAAAGWLVYAAMSGGNTSPAAAILLVYWTLSLPDIGGTLCAISWQWPALRNGLTRLLEPLGAPEEAIAIVARASGDVPKGTAARIEMRDVATAAGGHLILHDINLKIEPGEHVGIVGLSGAGKSSLVGLLLGWYRATAGEILVDGERLDAAHLRRLREQTAWVDPQVQVWNQSLLRNLRYGLNEGEPLDAARAIELANLGGVIQNLPDGMQTALGENGTLVSGGEGQRVRMARAYGRPGVRLAILDEPARGLDRGMREEFVDRAREAWKDATLLCITHDVASTKVFSRVLVIEDGQIREDGDPAVLYADATSRYRELCDREDEVRERLWQATDWRRFRMESGVLRHEEASS